MHALFVTEGVVLGKRTAGEANTRVAILTEKLGLVAASAKSARVEKSKLRYGLEPLTQATFSLIRGKYEWKLTGVQHASKEFISEMLSRRMAAGRIAKLLLRLVQGEEPVSQLYKTVAEGLKLVATQGDESIEIVLVLRILSHLGYLPHHESLAPFIEEEFSLELSAKALDSRALLIRTINTSLQSSGL